MKDDAGGEVWREMSFQDASRFFFCRKKCKLTKITIYSKVTLGH